MKKIALGLLPLAGFVSAMLPGFAIAQERPSFYNPEAAAQIVLPDRRVCTYGGAEPRERDLGDPITYRCDDGRGLRGDVMIDGAYMTVDREGFENLDRDAIIESEEIRFLIEEIALADGAVCRFAGEGATLAFDGERVNYTCGNPAVVLLGDIEIAPNGVFRVTKGRLNGTDLASSETVAIERLGAMPR